MSGDENKEPVEASEEELETEEVSEAQVKEEPEVEERKTKKATKEEEVVEKEVRKEEAPKEKGAKKEKEEKAKEKKEKEEEEDKVVEEKVITINLRHAYLTYGRKAAPKAVRLVKKVTKKIFKTEDVTIDNSLNAILWSRGKTKTERKVSVKVQKLKSGTVRVLPAEA